MKERVKIFHTNSDQKVKPEGRLSLEEAVNEFLENNDDIEITRVLQNGAGQYNYINFTIFYIPTSLKKESEIIEELSVKFK